MTQRWPGIRASRTWEEPSRRWTQLRGQCTGTHTSTPDFPVRTLPQARGLRALMSRVFSNASTLVPRQGVPIHELIGLVNHGNTPLTRIPTPPPTLGSASPVLSSPQHLCLRPHLHKSINSPNFFNTQTSCMFYSFRQLPIAGETEATTKVAPQQQPSPFNAEHKRKQALEPRRPRSPQRNRIFFPATISQKRPNHHTHPRKPTNAKHIRLGTLYKF